MYQCLLDFWMFFFPSNCLVCGKRLASAREVLCFNCEYLMPKVSGKFLMDHPVSSTFWGRVPLEGCTSLFRFEKGSRYQILLHDLKYRGNRQAGLYLGRLLGQELLHSPFACCDLLVPVPLHARKRRQRGYNQSEVIARACSEVMGIPLDGRLLVRPIHRSSQTRLSRQDRFENVKNDFAISRKAGDINGMRILLVDDVLTTGATLEACCSTLLGRYNCLIFVATVAYA